MITTKILVALGQQLYTFGEQQGAQAVMTRAREANAWFSQQEICRAAQIIAEQMLTREKLTKWLAAYPVPVASPRRVLVVMAGNIPFVGFFDLLCVLAAGHHCLVKPASKDAVLMTFIIEKLKALDPDLLLEIYDGKMPIDAVIATGSDNANRYFRANYAGIPALLRGSRQSVAVLSGRENATQLQGLTDDIFAYSGLGCRNVSLLFLPRGYLPSLSVPVMNRKYHNNYLQTKALLSMSGHPYLDLGHAVLVESQSFPTALSQISYIYYDDLEDVRRWLMMHDTELQCVVSECVVHPRCVALGRAQWPALTDYADDVDVMQFLCKI